MPKTFRELSVRQKNRRLQTYERYERKPIHADRSTATIGVSTCESLADENVLIQQNNLLEDFNSNNALNEFLPNSDARIIIESEVEQNINENINTTSEFSNWLRSWKLKHNITHTAFSELLCKLRTCGHSDLPQDARTFLNTPKNNIVDALSENESFFHYGLEKAIIEQLVRTKCTVGNEIITIDLNIDVLPISKSSKSQIWPILGKIYGNKAFTPFVISAYHGYSKSCSIDAFLKPLCEEYTALQNAGLVFGGKKYTIRIRCVICDSPARAFVTCTKSHNGYFGCGKCMQEGTYSNHHMLFLESTAPLRTDANFSNRVQEDHHTGVSPFESIQLSMVSRFPLDYMHLVCLGVTKKMLLLWLSGHQTSRFGGRKIIELSEILITTSKWVPKEFARKPRSLDEVSRWKATELRQFLLYLGPVVLQNILPANNVLHFNALNCAMRILCHPTDCFRNNQYSRDLLIQFVETFKQLYGDESVIYNVHNLLHLNEDVLMYGSLDNFSAFPFENYMQSIKKMLRKADKPLQQLYR